MATIPNETPLVPTTTAATRTPGIEPAPPAPEASAQETVSKAEYDALSAQLARANAQLETRNQELTAANQARDLAHGQLAGAEGSAALKAAKLSHLVSHYANGLDVDAESAWVQGLQVNAQGIVTGEPMYRPSPAVAQAVATPTETPAAPEGEQPPNVEGAPPAPDGQQPSGVQPQVVAPVPANPVGAVVDGQPRVPLSPPPPDWNTVNDELRAKAAGRLH